MGASISPTVANIFMSVMLHNFLTTTREKPILMKRYIDDLFIIWPKKQNLHTFIHHLNYHHPNIKFTSTQSNKSVDFLNITIKKRDNFTKSGKLQIQKQNNLYQYVHFLSNHPKSTLRGLIIGEATRYLRTNSTQQLYLEQIRKFTNHLIDRKYPPKFIKKALKKVNFKKVNYKRRTQYIQQETKPAIQPLSCPIFKCIPPPTTTS